MHDTCITCASMCRCMHKQHSSVRVTHKKVYHNQRKAHTETCMGVRRHSPQRHMGSGSAAPPTHSTARRGYHCQPTSHHIKLRFALPKSIRSHFGNCISLIQLQLLSVATAVPMPPRSRSPRRHQPNSAVSPEASGRLIVETLRQQVLAELMAGLPRASCRA